MHSLWIEFNPVNIGTQQYDQLELHHFNNIAQLPFYVGKDIMNPILDVTFDGVRILDGDIVSARPSIQVMLKDENRYLLLYDTSAFKVFIQKPIVRSGNAFISDQTAGSDVFLSFFIVFK
jgi:hypothetical protein